jgi:hypothetical protein
VTHEEIKKAWNSGADAYNCWDALGEDEQVMFAYRKGLEEAADRAESLAHSGKHCCREKADEIKDSIRRIQ